MRTFHLGMAESSTNAELSSCAERRFRRSARFAVTLATVSAIGIAVLTPTEARAQGAPPNCEPGSWFCGETQPPPPKPPPAPPPPAAPAPEAPVLVTPAPPPPPAPPPVIVIQPREAPPPYHYVPKPPPRKTEWGLNLHVGAATFGARNKNDSGMGLVGVGLRLRPIPHVALEANFDLAGGRDVDGNRRGESALTFNGLLFFNPKSVAQVYALAGFGWSAAHVSFERSTTGNTEANYAYFGGQAGLGIEFRLSRTIALNADVRGLIRARVDDYHTRSSEFVSSDGRTTNTSGAGLAQAGITFYW